MRPPGAENYPSRAREKRDRTEVCTRMLESADWQMLKDGQWPARRPTVPARTTARRPGQGGTTGSAS